MKLAELETVWNDVLGRHLTVIQKALLNSGISREVALRLIDLADDIARRLRK
jgi:hypothetical protein